MLLDPAASVAQVKKQQRVLPGMATTHAVVEAPFMTDHVGQCAGFGGIQRIAARNPRVVAGTVVVDQLQGLLQGLVALLG